MDLVFMGTAEFACPALEALASAKEHRTVGVVTQPDRPSGRQLKLTPSPVKEVALRHHFAIYQPNRIKEPSFIDTLRYLHPELIVVIAYGQILPREILQLPKHGCVNVHGSLLPKYRGASPIQAALLHGDTGTGVTTMFMDEGMDTGDIILQKRIAIEPDDTAQTLHDRLAPLGAELLLRTLELLALGQAPRTPQDASQASACKKLTKADGQIDWKLPASDLLNRIRAFNPWPGAFTFLGTPHGRKLLKIWSAEVVRGSTPHAPGTVARAEKKGIVVAAGSEALRIRELQLEGSRRVSAKEFLLGHDVQVGTVLQ